MIPLPSRGRSRPRRTDSPFVSRCSLRRRPESRRSASRAGLDGSGGLARSLPLQGHVEEQRAVQRRFGLDGPTEEEGAVRHASIPLDGEKCLRVGIDVATDGGGPRCSFGGGSGLLRRRDVLGFCGTLDPALLDGPLARRDRRPVGAAAAGDGSTIRVRADRGVDRRTVTDDGRSGRPVIIDIDPGGAVVDDRGPAVVGMLLRFRGRGRRRTLGDDFGCAKLRL